MLPYSRGKLLSDSFYFDEAVSYNSSDVSFFQDFYQYAEKCKICKIRVFPLTNNLFMIL